MSRGREETPSSSGSSEYEYEEVVEYVTTETESKPVEWPPKEGKIVQDDGGPFAVRYSAKKYDVACQQQAPKRPELFKPGRILADNRWKPEETFVPKVYAGRPKRTIRKVEEIIDTDGHRTQVSYHVPPGTTRTRQAHARYQKSLDT